MHIKQNIFLSKTGMPKSKTDLSNVHRQCMCWPRSAATRAERDLMMEAPDVEGCSEVLLLSGAT